MLIESSSCTNLFLSAGVRRSSLEDNSDPRNVPIRQGIVVRMRALGNNLPPECRRRRSGIPRRRPRPERSSRQRCRSEYTLSSRRGTTPSTCRRARTAPTGLPRRDTTPAAYRSKVTSPLRSPQCSSQASTGADQSRVTPTVVTGLSGALRALDSTCSPAAFRAAANTDSEASSGESVAGDVVTVQLLIS